MTSNPAAVSAFLECAVREEMISQAVADELASKATVSKLTITQLCVDEGKLKPIDVLRREARGQRRSNPPEPVRKTGLPGTSVNMPLGQALLKTIGRGSWFRRAGGGANVPSVTGMPE